MTRVPKNGDYKRRPSACTFTNIHKQAPSQVAWCLPSTTPTEPHKLRGRHVRQEEEEKKFLCQHAQAVACT